MLSIIKSAAKRLPPIRRLIAQRQQLQEALAQKTVELELAQSAARRNDLQGGAQPVAQTRSQPAQPAAQSESLKLGLELAALRSACGFVAPGHYYSPLPDFDQVRREESRIFGPVPRDIPGLDLREADQLALIEQFSRFYPDIPFQSDPTPGLRYHYDNQSYAYSDGIMLHCMLRHLKPKRLIEIGSGYSSCVTLDTNDLFLDGALEATFIEPYPDLLMSLISKADRARVKIVPKRLQDVELDLFRGLGAGDVLFVDSTHVSKIDSDVNRLFFDILPTLAPGVVIHFHDIFYPFEYPKEWVRFGRAWNELYVLRAFLQFNSSFRILLMNTFIAHFHRPFLEQHMPLCLANTGGSIWLEKTQP
ncbi:MAG TPA: class I SAM-dependent methyltransferase [Ramlibacter sp.]|nr:class I SAM-dependent methyltransferase [Ramlibacter sp.]